MVHFRAPGVTRARIARRVMRAVNKLHQDAVLQNAGTYTEHKRPGQRSPTPCTARLIWGSCPLLLARSLRPFVSASQRTLLAPTHRSWHCWRLQWRMMTEQLPNLTTFERGILNHNLEISSARNYPVAPLVCQVASPLSMSRGSA
jgi:hypothetical protein